MTNKRQRSAEYHEKAERWYKSARWRKLRRRKLNRHPYCCCPCHGKAVIVEACIVDHVDPHRGDPKKFWKESNLQSLCKRCHDSCKQSEEARGYHIGCDQFGMPIDPDHPWNNEHRDS